MKDMDEFKESLNKLVDQVAETTKEGTTFTTEAVSDLWKEFIAKGMKAAEKLDKLTKGDA